MSGDRDLDVVVFGATGFVGRLLARYLVDHAPRTVRVGLAGRSEERLGDVRAQLGAAASSWPLLMADSSDPSSLAALATATRVVATTAGPYRPHGLRVVEACVTAGSDYVDLAAEVLFIRDSIDSYHATAERAGTRIVHSCGFDSIPSDLAVLLLHQAALADGAGDLEDTTLVVRALKGGLSGGTLASIKLQMNEVRASAQHRKIFEDPYALSPERAAEPELGDERDLTWIKHDDALGMWVGPFMLGAYNARVVRRSNALRNWAYGRRFRYREVTGFGASRVAPVKAAAASIPPMALLAGMSFDPSRAVLDRVLPAPGEGPSEKTRRRGHFRMEVHTRTSSGTRYVSHVAAQGDPGYAATSVMLGESALSLALDRDRLPPAAGVLTPATAFGNVLVDRLRAAGHTYTTQRVNQ